MRKSVVGKDRSRSEYYVLPIINYCFKPIKLMYVQYTCTVYMYTDIHSNVTCIIFKIFCIGLCNIIVRSLN